MGLWNIVLAGAGALAAFFFVRALVKGSPMAGKVSLALPRDGTMWLLLPGFLGVSLALNMVVSVLQRMLAIGTRYQIPTAVQLPEGRGAMVLYFIGICVVPAVVEELFVRGALQPMFARWGAWFSILLTSALFTLMHGGIAQMPAVFLISMVLGITAHASGSLLPGMVMHFANNCMSFCFTWAAQKLDGIGGLAPVSYTHLTLPTNREVQKSGVGRQTNTQDHCAKLHLYYNKDSSNHHDNNWLYQNNSKMQQCYAN